MLNFTGTVECQGNCVENTITLKAILILCYKVQTKPLQIIPMKAQSYLRYKIPYHQIYHIRTNF